MELRLPTGELVTLAWCDDGLLVLDQTVLPSRTEYLTLTNEKQMFDAIKRLVIRGGSAIGMGAAYGVYLGIWKNTYTDSAALITDVNRVADYLATSRPTAIMLFQRLDEIRQLAADNIYRSVEDIKEILLQRCHEIRQAGIDRADGIGEAGIELIKDGDTVLTHCNAGTYSGIWRGSLAPIYLAHEKGYKIKVYADETRPLLQGSRLTAHELQAAGIDVTVICDNMAGYLMQQGKIDAVIVGADRIAANGDVINKIGTYSVAVLARHHHVPFYVSGSLATSVDFNTATGAEVPIEERSPEEVTEGFGNRTAPHDINVFNPAFDVTPHELVTAFIFSDLGLVYPPFRKAFDNNRDSIL